MINEALVATAVTAWVTPSPMNILREGSYWKCLSDNHEEAGCHVLLTREQNP